MTVDRRRVPLGTQVTFNITPANVVRNYVVTLYFGDRQTRVMTEPQTVYVYKEVGNYTYAVDVKPRQPPDSTNRIKKPLVSLNASPTSVREAEPIKFSAQLSSAYPNVQYRFVFGDGSSSGWQSSSEAQHSYARAGNYSAYVDISDGKNRIGGSLRKRLEVTGKTDPADRRNVTVSLKAQPLPAQSGKPVTFTATASPARAGTRYLFNFGDGRQTLWQTDPQSTHTYTTQGLYRPYVQVSQFTNNQTVSATSAPARLRVGAPDTTPDPDPSPAPTPGPSPSPTAATSPTASDSPTPSPSNGSPSPGNGSPSPGNGSPSPGSSISGSNGTSSSPFGTPTPIDQQSGNKWWYLLIAAGILFLVYQATAFLFATQPTFAPFADHGVAAVASAKGALPIDFELVLDRNVSAGDYSVTTDQPRLVTNAPEPEDRQIIEI